MKLSAMAIVSVIGGAIGAVLLLYTPQSLFDKMFPFLLLFGVLVFAFGRKLGEELRRRMTVHPHTLPAVQFVLGIYGGYFGGAVGVMMLAAWSVLTAAPINTMQATRNLLNASMNAMASLLFLLGGLVYWKPTAVLLISATISPAISAAGSILLMRGSRFPASMRGLSWWSSGVNSDERSVQGGRPWIAERLP